MRSVLPYRAAPQHWPPPCCTPSGSLVGYRASWILWWCRMGALVCTRLQRMTNEWRHFSEQGFLFNRNSRDDTDGGGELSIPSSCTRLGCLISFMTAASLRNSSTSIVSSWTGLLTNTKNKRVKPGVTCSHICTPPEDSIFQILCLYWESEVMNKPAGMLLSPSSYL